ncbi:hypothetical protein B0H11DRAFT_1907907 [Mycena galericulata]|nr:hypothetical protein B0H11DRAFT_1907907 [Mycena galericulata]
MAKSRAPCTVVWLVTAQTLMTGFPNWDVMRGCVRDYILRSLIAEHRDSTDSGLPEARSCSRAVPRAKSTEIIVVVLRQTGYYQHLGALFGEGAKNSGQTDLNPN